MKIFNYGNDYAQADAFKKSQKENADNNGKRTDNETGKGNPDGKKIKEGSVKSEHEAQSPSKKKGKLQAKENDKEKC